MPSDMLGIAGGYFWAALLAATGVLLTCAGVASIVRWRFFDQRIREYVSIVPEPVAAETLRAADGTPAGPRPPGSRSRFSGQLHRRLAGTSLAARIQVRLARAGSTRRASQFLVFQAIASATVALLTLLMAGAAPAAARLVIAAGATAGGAMLPLLWLDMRANSRRNAFERQLPQAIDAMASSLQAGSTLNQSMGVLAREMPPPVSDELRRVLRETEVGLSFPDALAGLVNRVPSNDLLLFVSAISIQQRVGGDLAQIFRAISHTIRERLRVRGEMKVLTAQARYSSYIVAALPILLFTFLWFTNYTYLQVLFQPGWMRLLLYAGITGIALGFYSMNKLSQVDA